MIRGAYTPSLRVQTAPFGRCWYIYIILKKMEEQNNLGGGVLVFIHVFVVLLYPEIWRF